MKRIHSRIFLTQAWKIIILFNLYMIKLPLPSRGVKIANFAHYCAVLVTGLSTETIYYKKSFSLDALQQWFFDSKLFLGEIIANTIYFNQVKTSLNIAVQQTISVDFSTWKQ